MTRREAGRCGGLKGGPARARRLSKKRKREIARQGGHGKARKKLIRTVLAFGTLTTEMIDRRWTLNLPRDVLE